MKYLRKIYVKTLSREDLDLENPDEIFGLNEDGHDYDVIREDKSGGYYTGEVQPINIDTAIKTLNDLKKYSSANYVEIYPHLDHHGYHFTGIEMREATDDEVEIWSKAIEISDHFKKEQRIIQLEHELDQLKK